MKRPDELELLLEACVAAGASDLHLCAGEPARLRRHGVLAAHRDERRYSGEQIEAWLDMVLSENQRAELGRKGSVDFGLSSVGGERFRGNAFRAMDSMQVALRHLDNRFRSIEDLGLPQVLRDFARMRDGLVLVTGATGSGKSTTLAALIDEINGELDGHIVTIEDPVEFIHTSRRCLVRQREINRDCTDFAGAVRAALREDPDVILVGEMRDLETMRAALTAAETGHLVLSTLHTQDAAGSVERLAGAFPAQEQEVARLRLSLTLRGVVSQRLLPRADGLGRVPAIEVLVTTTAVANHIASGRSQQIYSAIETGSTLGMQTLEQSLVRLVADGRVAPAVARAQAGNPPAFDRLLKHAGSAA